jgi:hypothetical protein
MLIDERLGFWRLGEYRDTSTAGDASYLGFRLFPAWFSGRMHAHAERCTSGSRANGVRYAIGALSRVACGYSFENLFFIKDTWLHQ